MAKVCKDYGNLKKAKVLVIGHDPRLQLSNEIAEYCFYANFYSKNDIKTRQDKRKRALATSVYECIFELTNNKFSTEEIYITNLCNGELPHAPKKKTVYIPIDKAKDGINRIKSILDNSNIEYIFATSLKVNYWLQNLEFYSSNNTFLENTKVSETGKLNNPPYFKPTKDGTFKEICGNVYKVNDRDVKVIPILHPKQYPLNKTMKKHYKESYDRIKIYFS